MSRVIAQVVVAGITVVFRAATQAWSQALVNAQKTGVAQEATKQTAKVIANQMSSDEARMILQVKPEAPWGDVVKRYKHLFGVNDTSGSFYLQSKVYRARERLEQEYESQGKKTGDEPPDELPRA
mmetsp:Transcript_21436/g.36593  ORF Transcript_21436/g.36593 Transcript_21436/m.36593 type:complete len:125 (-) Transcript_21436:550-924(-)|eukprot:CAMPEP_0119102944 /NCGR_PEP_ID=MMETSP1180-20130426/1521_1 /TAXON_ID=3052 ORGANISM="Chlamydomonas cf sp, Strain CCMP681" /NCGR_SAMPLE_ID=MMETSP1180 /ASSEMBLY_ACC=CAM_ASM_000741 /LENGTH=124 /DNA_ID=CAMNT_0007087329 /DNA_START=80 /DNA_END=454 /DNA_ORIENTATION=+